jgi:hypothetical protein
MGVRWDAVVERSRPEPPPAPAARLTPCPSTTGATTSVEIWLFGSLADSVPERPLRLQFRNPFSIGDVIAELGRRCGAEFLSRVTAPDGGMLRHCRVFMNGEPVEDTGAPVCAQEPSTQIEMILLTAAEGG